MKTLKIKLTLILAALLFAACAASNTTNTPVANALANSNAGNPAQTVTSPAPNAANEETLMAKAIYEKQKCVVCHKENGEGGKDVLYGDITIDNVPSFQNPKVIAEPDAEYIKKIKRGGEGMPKYEGKLSDAEINALIKYIRAEFQGKS